MVFLSIVYNIHNLGILLYHYLVLGVQVAAVAKDTFHKLFHIVSEIFNITLIGLPNKIPFHSKGKYSAESTHANLKHQTST